MRSELAAVNTLGEKHTAPQLETHGEFASVRSEFTLLRMALADHQNEIRAGFRRVHEQLAEIKDLIIDSRGVHAPVGNVPGSGVSDGGVSVPDVRGPSRESLW